MNSTTWPCGSKPFRVQYSRKRRRTSASTRMLYCTLAFRPAAVVFVVTTPASTRGYIYIR